MLLKQWINSFNSNNNKFQEIRDLIQEQSHQMSSIFHHPNLKFKNHSKPFSQYFKQFQEQSITQSPTSKKIINPNQTKHSKSNPQNITIHKTPNKLTTNPDNNQKFVQTQQPISRKLKKSSKRNEKFTEWESSRSWSRTDGKRENRGYSGQRRKGHGLLVWIEGWIDDWKRGKDD